MSEARISALVAAEPVPVDPHDAVAEYAIEFNPDPTPEILLRNQKLRRYHPTLCSGCAGPTARNPCSASSLSPSGSSGNSMAQSCGRLTVANPNHRNRLPPRPRASPALTRHRLAAKPKSRAAHAACPSANLQFRSNERRSRIRRSPFLKNCLSNMPLSQAQCLEQRSGQSYWPQLPFYVQMRKCAIQLRESTLGPFALPN